MSNVVPPIGLAHHGREVFSTDEHFSGYTWVDGSPIYRKVIDFGALPNNGLKSVGLSISNLGIIVNMYGVASTASTTLSLPYSDPTDNANSISLLRGSTTLARILTGADYSGYSGFVIVEYTKSV